MDIGVPNSAIPVQFAPEFVPSATQDVMLLNDASIKFLSFGARWDATVVPSWTSLPARILYPRAIVMHDMSRPPPHQ